MEGQPLVNQPISKSSPIRRRNKTKPKDYSSCMLYNTAEVMNKLKDLKIALCNPSNEEIKYVRNIDVTQKPEGNFFFKFSRNMMYL